MPLCDAHFDCFTPKRLGTEKNIDVDLSCQDHTVKETITF